jgi:hypothetical protein
VPGATRRGECFLDTEGLHDILEPSVPTL